MVSRRDLGILSSLRTVTVLLAVFVAIVIAWQIAFVRHDSVLSSLDRLTGTATSGRRCKFVKSRNFDSKKVFYKETTGRAKLDDAVNSTLKRLEKFLVDKPCRYWGTLTTIFNPTEAVLTLPSDWCLVVAADRKGPREYVVASDGPTTILLSVEQQIQLARHFDLVKNIPWNHFARKNVAYLFAILNQAEWIWDFDDDNILYGAPDASDADDVFAKGVYFEPSNTTTCGALNPYMWLQHAPGGHQSNMNGNTTTNFWPRGYPLELIQSPSCVEAVVRCVANKPNVGIFQAIANGDPDVDAIYRLTGRLPVYFAKGTREMPILVPSGMLSPMNAQAALVHVERAAWSLFLPTTVHGRVSDIWRSYIAQTVGRFYGLQTAFLPDPLVRQDRNVHDYLADFNAEIPLYECAGALVNLLNAWRPLQGSSFPMALVELYILLYEHGVIQARDVDLIQRWLQSLSRVGYTFPGWHDTTYTARACAMYKDTESPTPAGAVAAVPPIDVEANRPPNPGKRSKTYFSNVALVGQFNYATDPDLVEHWVKRWSEVFRVVSVYLPFSNETHRNETHRSVADRGIDVALYQWDAGFYSPMRNLGQSLLRFATDPTIQGVMIAHDDMIMDVSRLAQHGFPDNGNILLQDPFTTALAFSSKGQIWGNGSFVKITEYMALLSDNWYWWPFVLRPFSNAVTNDTRSSNYVNSSGIATLHVGAAGDLVYIPTIYAKYFHDTAMWLADHKVFLEASMGTLATYIRDRYQANITVVDTCTAWGAIRDNPAELVNSCRQRAASNTTPLPELFHPVKLSKGLDTWDAIFDSIVYSTE